MSDGQKIPQHDDELLGQVKQRLLDEGFPPEREEALAGALLDPSSRLAGALGDVEANLERLSEVMA